MSITFIQTCDAKLYSPFIEVTSRTFRAYAKLYDVNYDCYIGIKRGVKPWHAALNRIVMLADMVRSGYVGWVFYADADSYIADLSFNVREYLESKKDFAFIVSPSGLQPPSWWEINNGVFAVNLSHWAGQKVVLRWEEKLLSIPEEILNNENVWGDVVDDQALMHAAFKECDGVEPFVFIDNIAPTIINWNSVFIRQIIRGQGSHSVRINKLSAAVDAVLGESSKQDLFIQELFNKEHFYEELATALYEVLLCRSPDGGGLKTALGSLLNGSRTIKEHVRSIIGSDEFGMRLPEILKAWGVSTESSDNYLSGPI